MTDSTQLYTTTLKVLGDSLVKMTSPEWDAMMQAETAETRRESALLMLRVQQARLTLANSSLSDIASAMKENEQGLCEGIDRVQKALDTFDNVEKVLKGMTAVVSVVAKIVTLL